MRIVVTFLAAFALFVFGLLADDTASVVSRIRPQAEPRDVMTNEGLVVLSEAGFSDSFIVEKILLSGTRFDTTEEGLAFLRRSGISDQLTLFVLEHNARPEMFRPAQPVPAMVAMKVVKMKVLVPQNAPVSAGPSVTPIPTVAPDTSGQMVYWFPADRYGVPAVATNYGWGAKPLAASTAPPYPALPAPAVTAPASVPIMTPVDPPIAPASSR